MRTDVRQQQNLTPVREIYDAVGRGDVQAILDRCTDDVDWAAEAADGAAPWHGTRIGKPAVATFFSDLASSVEITRFLPHGYAASENEVHLLVDFTFRSRHTGREAAMTMHHYWRLRDGLVEYFRGSEDTAQTASVLAT